MAQYGSQYLLSCRKAMKDREKVLKAAIETFDQEEELLDFKIAKLRSAFDLLCVYVLFA